MPAVDEVVFKVRLDDQLSGPTRAMDASLTVLDKQLRRERAELQATEAAMRSLNKATVVDAASFRSLSAQATAQRDALNRTHLSLHQMGQSAATAAAATRRLGQAEGAAAKAAAAVQDLSGRFGKAASAAQNMTSATGVLDGAVVALTDPLVLAAAAVVGLGVAFGAAVIGGASLALRAADAKAEVEATLSLVVDTQAEVVDTYGKLSQLSSRLGVSQEATAAVASALSLAGVEGKDSLVSAVGAVQTAARISKEAGGKIQSLIERAGASGVFQPKKTAFKGSGVSIAEFTAELSRETGRSVAVLKGQLKAGKVTAEEGIAALSAAVHMKLDPVASALGRSFGSSVQRAKDSLGRLFENVNVVPFERALSRVVDLFDATTVGGKMLQDVLTPVFDRVFRALTVGAVLAERAILKVEIAFLDLYDSSDLFASAVDSLFPPSLSGDADTFDARLKQINHDLDLVKTTAGHVSDAFDVLWIAANPTGAVTTSIVSGWASSLGESAVSGLERAGSAIWATLKTWGAKAYSVGSDIVQGLVDGLKAGTENIIKVVDSIGSRAISAFRHAFDSHSPSRKTMRIGHDVSRGLEIGAERQAPERRLRLVGARSVAAISVGAREEVVRASSRAPELPRTVSSPAASGAQGGTKGGHDAPSSVDFSGMQIEINGVEGGEEVPEQLLPLFSDLFERAGLIRGTRPAGSGRAA